MALPLEQRDDPDARVSDYLDDRLQTAADLGSLDGLLADVQSRYGLLKQQLDEATRELDEAKDASNKQANALQKQIEEFNSCDKDIRRRLQILGLSETSDDAVPPIEAVWRRLDSLDETAGFIELLKEVDDLSQKCESLIQTPDGDVLEPYRQLQSLADRLEPLSVAADYGAPNLLNNVKKTAESMHRQIKDAYTKQFEAILKKIEWPKADVVLPGDLQSEWDAAVGRLLDLQMPELLANENARDKQGSKPPLVLSPFEILAQPLEMRFRYHFEGDRPTNRLDKPEYFLSHVMSLLNTYSGFMSDNVQHVLSRHFRGTDLALNTVYIDATSAFINSLLPMLKKKILSILPAVAKQPQLLSHTMHEIMNFDTSIRDEWRYDGGYGVQGWNGLAWEVLNTDGWFDRWLQNEKDFALSRYQDIIDSPDSGEIDFESVEPTMTKPTKAAIRVNDLLETITERYRPLSSFSQKLRFLIEIQVAIFDRYHERLYNGLEAYLALNSTIGRSMPGVVAAEQTDIKGIHGLERLCRIYGSADYLERAMRDWSDDVFFLELWEELQYRANKGSRSESVFSPTHPKHTVSDLSSRTSSNLGNGSSSGGALFDETASAYNRLRTRTEEKIIESLKYQLKEALRPYTRANNWTSIPSAASLPSNSQMVASAELDAFFRTANESLTFLKRALAPVPLRRVTHAVLREIQNEIWYGLLLKYSFSSAGAAQFQADIGIICGVFGQLVGKGAGTSGMSKLIEGGRLLGLSAKGQSKGGLEGDEQSAAEATADADGGGLSLWEVEKKLFADNESAREVLDELGMELLSENEARQVLGRRVELGS